MLLLSNPRGGDRRAAFSLRGLLSVAYRSLQECTQNMTWATVIALAIIPGVHAQWSPAGRESRLGPMLDEGLVSFQTPDFDVRLVRSSGTIAGLMSQAANDFDFTPGEFLAARSVDGYYHLGDIDLRLREVGSSEWKGYSTALKRVPVHPLPAQSGELARYDLAPTLPTDFPLELTRVWLADKGNLVLRFALKNLESKAIEVGSLGIPLIFDNIMSGKGLDEAHAVCSFSDPAIAIDGGYVQVTRLNGHGPVLLIVPDGNTPFEAYNPIPGPHGSAGEPVLFHDRTPRNMTFEGFYEWMVASRAYAETDWKGVQEWNPSTSFTIAPGEERVFGLRFLVAPTIREIETTLIANHRPVAVGIPGYVLPKDQDGKLFLKYTGKVARVEVEPAGAVDLKPAETTRSGWQQYAVHGRQWGRSRVTLTYADGLKQSVQYFVTEPEQKVAHALGHFAFTQQWFGDPGDPFHRAPSVMSYDRTLNQIVRQDSRVWIAGLGDEAGSGSWLAAAMKEFAQPDKQEIAQLETFVDQVMWGGLQYNDGPRKFGVRKSLFYYQPDQIPAGTYDAKLDWHSWTSWNKEASEDVGRSYNYPHVVALYWALYRVARNYQGLVTHHDWQWYLDQAYETSIAMPRFAPDLSQFGQMEGDIFVAVLEDLRREGETEKAGKLEGAMRSRTEQWRKLGYPFGSEMPWDSTGQEEVYAWTRYFGFDDKAQVTLDAITGYMPAIPSWGYNGSARRYWDFLYGGKYPRLERQLHHYGSGLNAIPVLDAYRRHPDDLYLLRIGYGGMMGAITNIDQEGFSSAAFHSYPDRMEFDPYTGDYGPNFFGHVWNDAAYLVNDPEFGWLGFGGNIQEDAAGVTIEPRDGMRQRVFLASLGLWLQLDSGTFAHVQMGADKAKVTIELSPADPATPVALLRIEQPSRIAGIGEFRISGTYSRVRGGYQIPLSAKPAIVQLESHDDGGKSQ